MVKENQEKENEISVLQGCLMDKNKVIGNLGKENKFLSDEQYIDSTNRSTLRKQDLETER